MSEYVIQGQTLTGIADSIRGQLGTTQQYTPESMASAIGSIQGGLESIVSGKITGDIAIDATDIKAYGISFIYNPMRVYLPKCTNLSASNAIYSNSALYCACFDAVQSFGILSMGSNTSLNAVIVRSNSIPSVQTSTFNNTPIASGTGYIYVPDDLVAQYQVATNWVTYAEQIKGMSEIPADIQEWLDQQGGTTV